MNKVYSSTVQSDINSGIFLLNEYRIFNSGFNKDNDSGEIFVSNSQLLGTSGFDIIIHFKTFL